MSPFQVIRQRLERREASPAAGTRQPLRVCVYLDAPRKDRVHGRQSREKHRVRRINIDTTAVSTVHVHMQRQRGLVMRSVRGQYTFCNPRFRAPPE